MSEIEYQILFSHFQFGNFKNNLFMELETSPKCPNTSGVIVSWPDDCCCSVYSLVFRCDVSEAEPSQILKYQSLAAFFRKCPLPPLPSPRLQTC